MAEIIKKKCPVCKSECNEDMVSQCRCNVCGFEYAFISYFANENSKNIWENNVKKQKQQRHLEKIKKYATTNSFVMGSDFVVFISPDTNKMIRISGTGEVQENDNISQYNASERNVVLRYKDGTIHAQGDNNYGQCVCKDISEVVYAVSAPNCTYAVTQNGMVKTIGTPIDATVKKWTDITMVACGAYHMLGLQKNGKVLIAGQMLNKDIIDTVKQWENVTYIAAATDCSVALLKDKTVAFAGRENDARNDVKNWKDIVAIAVDSSYVVGLTKEGNIQLAGKCKTFLDMGRSSAKEWKNIVAISCSKSGIGAINEDGELLLVGNFAGDIQKVQQVWKENIVF